MIPHHHLRKFHQTTKLLSSLVFPILVFACTSRQVEKVSNDTIVAAQEEFIPQRDPQAALPRPDNGEWDGSLNYVLDISGGSVANKDIVVIVAIDKEPESAHYVMMGPDQDMSDAVIYIINQPLVAVLKDTVEIYSQGLQQAELCFNRTVWYNIEFEDKSGKTYNGWISDAYGVYSVDQTEIGGRGYDFEGMDERLWLGSMNAMEVDLRYMKKDYDPAAADNCRDLNVLFFYNERQIYLIEGQVEDQWYGPGFNTSMTHLAVVNGSVDDLILTPDGQRMSMGFGTNRNGISRSLLKTAG
jgi:hypothetical protein